MNIYYFNITYSCNSNCVFCYSHNTVHSGSVFNEISCAEIVRYLEDRNVKSSDRIILNGGEPFLHTQIIEVLKSVSVFNCEILIYTNGRLLDKYDFGFLTQKYRFIVPIHGHRELHDKITRCKGSFDETSYGLCHLAKYDCKVDIKIILNPVMVSNRTEFAQTISDLDLLEYNNAVHITKMADTIVSKRNGIPSVSNNVASIYTALLFDHFRDKRIVKIFDTCIKNIDITTYQDSSNSLRVFFKDIKSAWELSLETSKKLCHKMCPKSRFCISAVNTYHVLEFERIFTKGVE